MITPKEPVKNPTVRCKVCKGACVITSFMCIDCDLKRRREFKAKHQQPRPSVFQMDLKLYFHEWMLRLRDASRRKRAQTFRLRVAPFPLHMLNTFAQWIYSMDPLSPSVPTQTRGVREHTLPKVWVYYVNSPAFEDLVTPAFSPMMATSQYKFAAHCCSGTARLLPAGMLVAAVPVIYMRVKAWCKRGELASQMFLEIPVITLSTGGWMFPGNLRQQDRDAAAAYAAVQVLKIQAHREHFNSTRKHAHNMCDLIQPAMLQHARTAISVHRAAMLAEGSETEEEEEH